MAEPASEAVKRKAEETSEVSPKKAKTDSAALKKQVEYYLSDENLKHDKFFHEKITADAEGWLDMSLVLSCNKMKTLKATAEDVIAALKDSTVEVRETDAAKFIRRPGNAPLPTLEARNQNKKQSHAHDGGCVVVIKEIPEDQSWKQVKDALKAKLPEKVGLWHASPVSDKGQCVIAVAPFEGDVAFLEALVLEVGGKSLKCEVPSGEALQTAVKVLPLNVQDRRTKEARKVAKERNKPIVLGQQRFLNIAALKGRVKEIMNSRTENELMKTDGTDFKLMKALLEFHPKGEEKYKGLVGLKVAKSSQGPCRCMWMVKEGDVSEDFSVLKCLEALEKNPPYAQEPKLAAAAAAAPTAAPAADAVPAADKPAAAAEKPAESAAESPAEAPAEAPAADAETPAPDAEKSAEAA